MSFEGLLGNSFGAMSRINKNAIPLRPFCTYRKTYTKILRSLFGLIDIRFPCFNPCDPNELERQGQALNPAFRVRPCSAAFKQ